jgi:hypothetical protein
MNNRSTIEHLQFRNSGVNFVLCGACFWCTSAFRSDEFSSCPSCKSKGLDSMPISSGEKYIFDYDEKRGIVLDFAPTRK